MLDDPWTRSFRAKFLCVAHDPNGTLLVGGPLDGLRAIIPPGYPVIGWCHLSRSGPIVANYAADGTFRDLDRHGDQWQPRPPLEPPSNPPR